MVFIKLDHLPYKYNNCDVQINTLNDGEIEK